MTALRTNDSYLQALLPAQEVPTRPRPRPRRGQALNHLRRLAHASNRSDLPRTRRQLLHQVETSRNPERQTKRLLAQLQRLGHTVTLQEVAA